MPTRSIPVEGRPELGRVVGGILDPRYEGSSYFTVLPCPQRGFEVTLEDHRSCEHFGGVILDQDEGVYVVCCRYVEA